MQTGFSVLCQRTPSLFQYITWVIFFGKIIGPTKKATGSDILLSVLYYGVRKYSFSQGSHIGYDSGDEIMNYTLKLA